MTTGVISLNQTQRLVAENTTDNILLMAGAGTGKTGTLAARVSFLLKSGVRPEEILCLTFTNRACREMTERVEATAGELANGVTVRTFHSFCAWFLRSLPKESRILGTGFAVCDEEDAKETIAAVVAETLGRAIDGKPLDILQSFIGLVKETQLRTGDFDCHRAAACLLNENRQAVEKICKTKSWEFDPAFFGFLAKYGASVTELYNRKLRESNLVDFNDLPLFARHAMDAPEVQLLWAKRYRYAHVDEAQDMNLAEYGFLTRFCVDAKLMLCGDFNQTIYEWRGSAPDALIASFTRDFSPEKIQFTQNYRAGGELIQLAENYLYHAFGQGNGSSLNPARQNCTQIRLEQFENPEQEVAWMYRQIEALELEDFSRCAILTRNNQTCKTLCDHLKLCRIGKEKPLRFMLADELRLFRRPEVKDMIACLRIVQNPFDTESMRRLAIRFAAGIGPGTMHALQKVSAQVRLADFLHERTIQTGDFFAPLLDALAQGRVVVFDVESTGTDAYTDDVIQIAAIRLDADGKENARFERFLVPGKPVGDSEKVHGFSDAFLSQHGLAPKQALESFLAFVAGCVVVGHNVRYDMTITAENMVRYGVTQTLDNLWYDTLDLARRFLPKLENHKLATVAAFLEAHVPTHDAMDDILATAGVLDKLTKQFLQPGEEQRRRAYAEFSTKFLPIVEKLRGLLNTAQKDIIAVLTNAMETFALPAEAPPEQIANRLLLRDFAGDFVPPELPLQQQITALLELTALTAGELDRLGKSQNKIPVITVHQSKGCEFDYVFMPMLCDGVFPSYQAVVSENDTEEKRVFYVSITRAKKRLYLSWTRRNAKGSACEKSRYLKLLESAHR